MKNLHTLACIFLLSDLCLRKWIDSLQSQGPMDLAQSPLPGYCAVCMAAALWLPRIYEKKIAFLPVFAYE